MDDKEVIAYFDGRPRTDITIGASWDIPRIADIAYEFGYVLALVFHGRGATRLVFERDDREHARRRAEWSVGYYRTHGTWGRPQPRFQLPAHLGRRIDPLEAAQARYALGALRNRAWSLRVSAFLGALLAIVVWRFRDSAAVVVPVLLAGVPFVLAAALSPWLPSKRLRRYRQTVETFELQQAVERGFIPPPPPGGTGD